MKLAAVIVTHDRLEQLRVTLSQVLAEPLDHVLVFDNASSDGTAEWLSQQRDPRLAVRRSETNIGGAGGFSEALKQVARQEDPDWTVVMDDDGRPMPGAMSIFRGLDHRAWDAFAAAVLNTKGEVCEMNRPYRNPFWHIREFLRTLMGQGRRGFHLQDTAYASDAGAVAVDAASFVGLFLSRRAIERAGFPDARLFIYGDDQLYTLKMRRMGLRIGFVPQLRFEHDTSSRQGKRGVLLTPLWRGYYMYRNAFVAYRVAAGMWFWLLVPLLLIKWRRQAKDYGPDCAHFRRILHVAIRDGLVNRLDRDHQEIINLPGAV